MHSFTNLHSPSHSLTHSLTQSLYSLTQVADNNSERLEWIVIWLIAVEVEIKIIVVYLCHHHHQVVMGIASNPLFQGRRLLCSLLVPTAIVLFKKINWSNWL
jgi:hypothetical protein